MLMGEPALYDAERPAYALRAPAGVSVEAGPLWIPSLNEMVWRVKPQARGSYELRIVARNGTATAKDLQVSDWIVRRSPSRSSTLLDQLWNPTEAPLRNDGHFQVIVIDYPPENVSFFGFELSTG